MMFNLLIGFLIGFWIISLLCFTYYVYKVIKVDYTKYRLGMWISVLFMNVLPAIMRLLLEMN